MSMRQRRPASPFAQRNNARAFRHSVLAVGIAMLLASPAMAQDAATQQDAAGQDGKDKKEDAKDLDKVVVTGIRGSVYKAQDIKRDADTFVDSVTALDIGALPDRSVTETLSRIPGVTIDHFLSVGDPEHFSAEGNALVAREVEKRLR